MELVRLLVKAKHEQRYVDQGIMLPSRADEVRRKWNASGFCTVRLKYFGTLISPSHVALALASPSALAHHTPESDSPSLPDSAGTQAQPDKP